MRASLALVAIIGLTLTACGDPGASVQDSAYPTRLVLSDDHPGSGFHPITGFGQTGISPIYDGLLRPTPGATGQLPNFAPALAADMPSHNEDATQWTVRLKDGVMFTDGSTVDATDVVASYRTAQDISQGSEVASSYELITRIDAPDPHTVVFHLAVPVSDFAGRLTYPITPSEKQGLAELNEHPVGTGPYEFVSHKGNDTVFKANEKYWGGEVPIKELIITDTTDDAARAQRVVSGELSGAVIPALHAKKFLENKQVQVDVAKGADWRAISLPATPELRDPRVRRALNIGTNRQALIDGPFAGYGSPAHTPIPAFYGSAHEPEARFEFDVAAANALLDEAGLARQADGTRFHLDLYYPASDSGRRDVAVEFASQMKALGVSVEPKAGTWDDITPRMAEVAVVLGGGEMPYDVSMSAYDQLHTRTTATSPYHNAGNYGSAELDRLVEDARGQVDTAKRDQLWRGAQQEYVKNPSLIMVGTVDHVYLSRANSWVKPPLMLEPHVHGATWGPWWNLAAWKR